MPLSSLAPLLRKGRGAVFALGLAALPIALGGQAMPSSFDMLPGWTNDRTADAVALFAKSCPKLDPIFRASCAEVRHVPVGNDAAARAFLEWAFQPVLVGNAQFTGYFELDVPGSRTQGGIYQWPLLRPPPDPNRFDRASILAGALANRGLELVWLTSAADLYFVQLQGSARVHLPDGSMIRVGGEVQNGRKSIPTADLFGDAGVPNHDLSIPAIRGWASAHPAEAQARIAREQSYFFFGQRQITDDEGPVGALGVHLAPLRSVAVDPAHVRLGAFLWINTEVSASHQPLRRLVLAQDTGEPIRGAAHLDLFFGSGDAAEATGGRENAKGQFWVLAPK